MGRNRATVTIRDVAQAAGVSISTVSRVLNNKDDVAPETYQVGALSDWQYLKDTPYPIDLFIRKEVYRHKHVCSAVGYLPPA